MFVRTSRGGDVAEEARTRGRRLERLAVRLQAELRLRREDVERLARERSAAARADVARRLGASFDELADGPAADLAESVLRLLVADVAREVRAGLAEGVADSVRLPKDVAVRLATDAIEIAGPVLERSPVLDEDTLQEIVRTRSWQYALAVAGRSGLSERLAHALLDTRREEVAARLAANVKSELTRAVLERIAAEWRASREVQDRLAGRPALPYELVEKLVEAVGERLGWELVRHRRISPEQASRIVLALREHVAIGMAARARDGSGLLRHLRQRWLAGELGPDDVLAFLRDGDIASLEAAFAVATGLSVRRVRGILYGRDRRYFAAMCARAGLPPPHYLALRLALELAEAAVREMKPQAYDGDALHFLQEQYERYRGDPALVEELLGPAGECPDLMPPEEAPRTAAGARAPDGAPSAASHGGQGSRG